MVSNSLESTRCTLACGRRACSSDSKTTLGLVLVGSTLGATSYALELPHARVKIPQLHRGTAQMERQARDGGGGNPISAQTAGREEVVAQMDVQTADRAA